MHNKSIDKVSFRFIQFIWTPDDNSSTNGCFVFWLIRLQRMPIQNSVNPYTPPALKTSILTKIKKDEYVDFDDLLPTPPSLNSSPDELLGFQLDASNNLLVKPNTPKAKIRDYPAWICAWNIYYQAMLYHDPSLHFKLFSYFKNFCNLARKHQFESCYAYDKAQRQTIAAQANLPLSQKTAHWTTIN